MRLGFCLEKENPANFRLFGELLFVFILFNSINVVSVFIIIMALSGVCPLEKNRDMYKSVAATPWALLFGAPPYTTHVLQPSLIKHINTQPDHHPSIVSRMVSCEKSQSHLLESKRASPVSSVLLA